MDQEHFDQLTRTLGSGQSRRGLLRGLTGGLVAGAASLIVGRSALADHNPDHCAQAGEKEHLNQNQPKSCCPGLAPDASGRCQPPAVCTDAVLAGAAGPTATFIVDDDLEVLVNGVPVFTDNDEVSDIIRPIPLGSLTDGDLVRVVASNATSGYCGSARLYPVTLYCPSKGTSQAVNPTYINQPSAECGAVIFDETVTVAL